MIEAAAARNLRTAERFLLAPPLAASFGTSAVAVCDISARGARFRHDKPLETGRKALLTLPVDGRPSPISLEAVIVWTQADASGRWVSGAKTYGAPDVMTSLLAQLQTSRRTNRIEELRASDRFDLRPSIAATFGGRPVVMENLSARGARIATPALLPLGTSAALRFVVPVPGVVVEVGGSVVWSGVRAVGAGVASGYRAGIAIAEKPELLRLAIGQLCETNNATLDTHSLALKLKIIRARARQLAPSYQAIEASGIPAEQYLLIHSVREELRLNPEEALHWYRRARIVINDPTTRTAAPAIADHPDALAVWEYLDRSVDPSIVGRAFSLR